MNKELQKVFTDIYKFNTWGGKESRSGPGSDKNEVDKIRMIVWDLHDMNSILNIPCGDQEWHKDASRYGFKYIGADIVPELIEANRQKYPDIDFRLLDITTDELPKVDLVFTRDLFGHLTYIETMNALNNIKRSGSKYLLTTSFTGRTKNLLTNKAGGWYPINICIEPFNLIPIYLINEGCTEGNGAFKDKCLMLFEIKDLPEFKL